MLSKVYQYLLKNTEVTEVNMLYLNVAPLDLQNW
jgi:hypothetical protein